MEKIRSGQSFLYRNGGLNSTIIDTRLKEKVNEGVLNRALIETIKRYPYFSSKLVERNGDYYIADNRDISLIAKRKNFHALGSMSAGYHPVMRCSILTFTKSDAHPFKLITFTFDPKRERPLAT